MELLWILLALAFSYAVYFLEQKRWTTVVRTTEQHEFLRWCAYLDSLAIPYKTKTSILVERHQPQIVYKIKVHVRQAGRIKAPQ